MALDGSEEFCLIISNFMFEYTLLNDPPMEQNVYQTEKGREKKDNKIISKMEVCELWILERKNVPAWNSLFMWENEIHQITCI